MMDGGAIEAQAAREDAADWQRHVEELREAYMQSQEFRDARARMIAEKLVKTLHRLAEIDREVVALVVSHAADEFRAGWPQVPLHRDLAREEARDWAARAESWELSAYLGAALAELRDRRIFPARAAAALMVQAWSFLPREYRLRFLARVDPQGRLRGGKA